ncbi:MAG: hypothetical protein COY42_27920 [Armatimonadetes bacterium CG_4_10_14_0_8_um_filter_66_14]|nr:MAG: hypothetical protein COY42_27920 [Armatimonadetes bacterium CG_4_10_14_0_8_um_filter_66_14]
MPRSAPAKLWISQADSDWVASGRVYDPNDHRTYCQAIAKSQQVVEKCVKAMAAAVEEAGVASFHLPHFYLHSVRQLMSVLLRLPRSRGRSIQDQIGRVLNEWRRTEIQTLSDLAPHRPPHGGLHARNTEYPYERSAGDWTAPALLDAFSQQDVDRFKQLAEAVFGDAKKVVWAVSRLP